MNREIKFKAYIEVKNEQKFYNDEEVKLIDKKLLNVIEIWWKSGEVADIYTGQSTIFANYCNIKLLQYTGLKDKNGREIYEGDIIDINQTVNGCNLFAIVWDKIGFNARYWVNNTADRKYEYDIMELLDVNVNKYDKDIEVVGNIYENKELLEDGNVRN